MQAVILAAGFSRRFGGRKLLTNFHQKPLVAWVMDLVAPMDFREIILVYQDEEVGRLGAVRHLRGIVNDQAFKGISSSIQCAVRASRLEDDYIFFMGDQPCIDSETVASLLTVFYQGKASIVAPKYQGNPGNPVIFSSVWRQELLGLTGDRGGRAIMERHSEQVYWLDIPNGKAGRDIDTREDYQEMEKDKGIGDGRF